ncbi:hypothetical protein PIIN_03546 [Serendipita indica DSM 11827]|uniref:MYND-type domain-containing protein n=1 Tax=Serendipita indica (strain DSM 11827) TaxID=1109443 RepID=G4TE64_SERID|nr:hypothetical protein PIIN_03546 [Serendipita indica DSM 11827]
MFFKQPPYPTPKSSQAPTPVKRKSFFGGIKTTQTSHTVTFSTPPSRHAYSTHQPSRQHQQRYYQPPRSFDITSPSGKKQRMIFVERVSHVTAQVEYGLVPADAKLRRYDEQGNLVGNEGMELLSPKVCEDTVRGTFFFAERRGALPSPKNRALKKEESQESGKGAPSINGQDVETIQAEQELEPQEIPTILEQLVELRVLRIIPSIRCRSREHAGACLVRILLPDSEIGHSCSSPRHPYVLYEATPYPRFKVCTACRAIPGRRGVFYCSEACLAAAWPQHRIECGKSKDQLQQIVSILPTIIQPRPTALAHIRVQTHKPAWYRAWLWFGHVAETNPENKLDFQTWKANVRERRGASCQDLLPGF